MIYFFYLLFILTSWLRYLYLYLFTKPPYKTELIYVNFNSIFNLCLILRVTRKVLIIALLLKITFNI